ncbi:double-strand break repair helicase AddA [Thalassococcus sp. S3]|uniref:double-strand break repair helicase AddA n=1 Tax=Thalassococcus sp. S3 TaxID=2017482 RepID=UPI00102443A5|nr:double-strand break repair helicase AddA [Thalassococcus sp. S3]QBF29613.1 double-strand break repair helicase AddA [Thalassococcus sp. S3]
MSRRNAATERQVQAADPRASTWLAANAGSGKTRVLTDRVARLLLDGTEPQRILCLTYTKAAASEMQNRLFARLGSWAMLADDPLKAELSELGVDGPLDPLRLRDARTLFARAIETPGGLKIQTIHSFCASLLRRFPLEAGVSPQFREIEDRAAALLRNEIVEDMAQGTEAHLVRKVAAYLAGDDLETFTQSVVSKRTSFADVLDWRGIAGHFGLSPSLTEDALSASVFVGGEADLLNPLVAALKTGGTTDQKAAAKLSALSALDFSALETLEAVFLTGPTATNPFAAKMGEERSKFPTGAVRKAHPDLIPPLEAWMARVEDARAQRIALAAARKADALHGFAHAFLPRYAFQKQARGWLDFDDLILKARQLLNDPAVAAWVLFRLDGGIDHILVDEAQDTSPEQWDVIEKLAQEFTSGLGARPNVERTIFVVGDKKQSIYSFQGADAAAFDRMQAEFGRRLEDSGTSLQSLSLEFSFRSAEAILRLVDTVFRESSEAGFHLDSQHRAFKDALPGRVDLWPVIEPNKEEDDRAWDNPVDRRSPQHHNVTLATQIADQISTWLGEGHTIPDEQDGRLGKRPIRAGDVLILVQRRSDLFAEIIRACKSRDIPIAGADRLKVGAELAVRDLAALLRFLATPEDSLSLATVLRSPLFGWSEQALFTLAHHRENPFLWQALRERTEEHGPTLAVLNDLRAQTDFLRPYDLIERMLTRHLGRRNLLSRLGREAEDGINALLAQALAYERNETPSLTGFLSWMETDDLEIKRQIDAAGDQVRVMTVHGSKGLEAPIVILPDTCRRRAPVDDTILMAGDIPVWSVPKAQAPDLIRNAREAAQTRLKNERLRLLYVALTRAEKWLIVAGAGELDAKSGDTWYQRVEAGLKTSGAETISLPNGEGLRLSNGDWIDLPDLSMPGKSLAATKPPAWISKAAPKVIDPSQTVSPSDLGGAKALPGEDGRSEEEAKIRGTRIHLLFEHLPRLPRASWPQASQRLLDLPKTECGALLDEATQVLVRPDLDWLFDETALSEVPISADLGPARLHGTIDRLLVSSDRVLAVDFKTNRVVPDAPDRCPEGVLRQMGAYSHALAQIFPEQRIETAILWTRTAHLMMLQHNLVMDSLYRTPYLDGKVVAP